MVDMGELNALPYASFYFHDFSFVDDCFIFTFADWSNRIVRTKKCIMTSYIRYSRNIN